MSNDDRIHRYLADQANAIDLPPADATGVARRGARRRNRRRGGMVAAVVIVGLAATSLAVVDRGGDSDADVTSFAMAPVTPSTYDWTVVDPESGLGYGRGSATLADGSIYSLSTAPGSPGSGPVVAGHLYRSTDGSEWGEVSLPSGLTASSLAGSGSTLYALGTAPASGGGRDLVLATSQDGASTWQQIDLPDEVTELDARFPDEIFISQPSVAALDADHVVAAVTVQAVPDMTSLIPELENGDLWYETTPDGVTVFEQGDCTDAEAYAELCVVQVDPRGAPSTEADDDKAALEAGQGEPIVHATYTWNELDLDPELEDLVNGRTYVYSTSDGASFERSTLPDGVTGTTAQAVATSDGYTVFVGDWAPDQATTTVLTSTDGAAFADAPGSPLPGGLAAAGVLADRPAVALFDAGGATAIQLHQPDGSWADIPLADNRGSGGEVAFGPLGFAAVVWEPVAGSDATVPHLVHSPDGVNLSSVSLEDELGTATPNVIGLTVTADAIFVRVGGPVDDDPSTPPVQQVLVGTPT
jgi:hypothetical protein